MSNNDCKTGIVNPSITVTNTLNSRGFEGHLFLDFDSELVYRSHLPQCRP